MLSLPLEAIPLVVIALIFGFFNGWHDASNVVATVISTRALSPRRAMMMAAVAEGVGPLLFGVAVARTIGHDVVSAEAVTLPVVYAALLAAILWNVITLAFGIPSSTSHALIGGIMGAVAAGYGFDAILMSGVDQDFAGPVSVSAPGADRWLPDYPDRLFPGAGSHAPYQRLVQTRADGHVNDVGAGTWGQRRAKDDGDHRAGTGRDGRAARISYPLVGDPRQRGDDGRRDAARRLEPDPHAGCEVLPGAPRSWIQRAGGVERGDPWRGAAGRPG